MRQKRQTAVQGQYPNGGSQEDAGAVGVSSSGNIIPKLAHYVNIPHAIAQVGIKAERLKNWRVWAAMVELAVRLDHRLDSDAGA